MATLAAPGCSGDGDDPASPSPRASALIHGVDDRVDYYQVADPALRALMSQTMVALIPRSYLRADGVRRTAVEAPSLGVVASLCPGEPFAEQPAAAFCTGVLLDWDLVLTAGHCVRLHPLQEIAIIFDYAYTAAAALAPEAELARPIAIVAEALDEAGEEPRLDYAWLRLDRPVGPSRAPAAVRRGRTSAGATAALVPGDPVLAIGASGGTPLKLDSGGQVIDARAAISDYFVADTDTFHGASGGGAFDRDLVLAGVFARGQTDFAATAAGCNVSVREPDASASAEQFTYAHRALDGLCRADASASSLCRADCGEPCRALPRPADAPDGGCTIAGAGAARPPRFADPVLAGGLALAAVRRARRRPRRSTRDCHQPRTGETRLI